MLEEIHDDLHNEQLSKDPDKANCTQPTWWKIIQDALLSFANSLAAVTWKDGEGQMVDKLTNSKNTNEMPLPCYRSVSWLCTRKADASYSPPVWTSVPTIRSKCEQHRPPCVTTERTWGSGKGKSTLTLEVWVRKLQGKTITRGGSCRTLLLQSLVGSSPQNRGAVITPDL